MATPPPSRLDSRQVLQGAFDEATGTLRTTAEATIVNADIDVSLDSSEDSVAIANAAGVPLTINADGSVNITDNGNSITIDGTVVVSNFPATQAISAAALPLPAGASTSALQTTGNTSLSSINTKTATLVSGRVPVDGSGVTQPISGTVTVSNPGLTDTQLRATSVPVSGTFFQTTQPVSGTVTVSNFPGTQNVAITSSVEVEVKNDTGNPIPVSGTVTANTGLSQPLTDTQLRATSVPVSGSFFQATQPISASALPLPSGASTSALQTTGNASLSSIDTKTPALGQALAASSVPVVLTASQLSTLTPLSSVSVSNFPATQTISGTVTANAGTNLNTSLLALDSTVAKDSSLSTLNTSVNTLLKPASTLAAVTSITNSVTIKADTSLNQTNSLKVDGSATTQPVSGTVTVSNPGLTDAQLRATALPVSGTVTVSNFPATQAISAAALPLPSGAATSALQTTSNSSLSSIDIKSSVLKTTQNIGVTGTTFNTTSIDVSVILGKFTCVQTIVSSPTALSGSMRVQVSNDNINWVNISQTETTLSIVAINNIFDFETSANFMRISATISAGTGNFSFFWLSK